MHIYSRDFSKQKDRGGFSFQEMLIVIAVIALLITFLIPQLIDILRMGRYTRWVDLQKSMQTRVYTKLLLPFQEDSVDIYEAGSSDIEIGKALGGGDITGRVYNTAKKLNVDGTKDPATDNSPNSGTLINGSEYKRTDANGDPLGRWKYKGVICFNEGGGNIQALNFGPKASIFSGGMEEFTVYAWIYPTDTSSVRTIMAHEHTTHTGNFKMAINPVTTSLEITVNDQTESVGTIDINKWTFICLRYSQDEAVARIDEDEFTTNLHTAGPLNNANASPLLVGATHTGGTLGEAFVGRIDEIGGFSHYLSENDIEDIYTHGSP